MTLHPSATPLLTVQDLATRLNVSRRMVETLLTQVDAPKPIRIGRLRRWTEEDLGLWIRRLRSTSEPGGERVAPEEVRVDH